MNDGLFRCCVCKDRKPPTQFYADNGRRTGLMARCKTCDGAMKARKYVRRQDGRRALITQAKKGPCVDCGVTYPPHVLDMEHRPGTQKRFAISNGMRFSVAEIIEELEKCDVVCANCHRLRSAQRARSDERSERSTPELLPEPGGTEPSITTGVT